MSPTSCHVQSAASRYDSHANNRSTTYCAPKLSGNEIFLNFDSSEQLMFNLYEEQTGRPSSQSPAVPRQSMSYSIKSRGGMRMSSPSELIRIYFRLLHTRLFVRFMLTSVTATPQYSVSSESSSSKSKSSQSNQTNKVPPLLTLVRGSGNNLAGKKPTYIPEDVVR